MKKTLNSIIKSVIDIRRLKDPTDNYFGKMEKAKWIKNKKSILYQ